MFKGHYRSLSDETRMTCSTIIRSCFSPRPLKKYYAMAVVLPLVLIGCGDEEKAAVPKADIGAGKSLAESQCAGCHGVDGKGAAPGIPNMAAQVERYLVESLLAYKAGKRTHAALRDMTAQLSDSDIRNVAGYYTGLAPLTAATAKEMKEILSPYEKGKAAAVACVECHSEDGNSKIAGTPSLAGQQPLYFAAAVRAYLAGARSKASMEMLRKLTTVDVQSLALFYASQAPAQRAAPKDGNPAVGEPLSARCGGCHGAQGVSTDSATPSLAGQDAKYLVNAIKAYRDRSRQHSVMLDTNSDEEIKNIAAFYAVQESKAAEGEEMTAQALGEKCDRCHGPGVENSAMAIPKISGQDKAYLIKAMRAYHDGKRGSSLMHNMSLPYSELLIESVASLYAAQPAR